MDQNAFRKLMMTPRPGGGGGGGSSSRQMVPPKAKPKSSNKKPGGGAWKKQTDKEKEENQYRDRAGERREGSNADYNAEDVQLADRFHELNEQAAGLEGNQLAAPTKTNEQRQAEIENSKYLGGDMEHTHLVKGLDFALLNKVRSEIKQKEPEKPQKQQIEIEVKKTETGFKSNVGRVIHNTLFGNTKKGRINELFLPGRMAFEFDLDPDFPQELPTTITRSKADCPRYEGKVLAKMPESVITRVEKIMHFVRQCALGKPVKRMKKKDRGKDAVTEPDAVVAEYTAAKLKQIPPPPPGPPPPDSDDDDIFGDAGKDYVCEETADDADEGRAGGSDASYFGNALKKDEEDAGPLHNMEEVKAMANALKTKEAVKEQEKKKAAIPVDDYDECYPENFSGFYDQYEGSDDEDGPKKKKGMDEEEEEGGKGGKANPSKKARRQARNREQQESQKRENKFNKEANQIAGIMKTKYGEDYGDLRQGKRKRDRN